MSNGNSITPHDIQSRFEAYVSTHSDPIVLEAGTKRHGTEPTSLASRMKALGIRHIGIDMEVGNDVDVIADLHHLPDYWKVEPQFAGIICRSTLEHVERPWVAAFEMAAVTLLGGHLWVSTHPCYPLHFYPNDYLRFSINGLDSVFVGAGWRRLMYCYSVPGKIIPLSNSVQSQHWNFEAETYLSIDALYERV